MGEATKRYTTYLDNEVYLLDMKTQKIFQITNNSLEKWSLRFSPDSKWLAFGMPNSENGYYDLRKIYITPAEDGEIKKLMNNFDNEVSYDYFWSDDSKYYTVKSLKTG